LSHFVHLVPVSYIRCTPAFLQHITIIGRHVAQFRLFILGQADILTFRAASILRNASEEIAYTAHCTQADERDTDAVAFVEEGLGVSRCETVTGNDSANISSSNLPGGSDTPPVVAT